MAHISVENVGHGNCAILIAAGRAAVFDMPRRRGLADRVARTVAGRECDLYVSHFDADHIGGIQALLGRDDVSFGLFVTAGDGRQATEEWLDLAALVWTLELEGRLEGRPSRRGSLFAGYDDVSIECLWPPNALVDLVISQADGMGAPTGNDGATEAWSRNSLSQVLRIRARNDDGISVLMTGDLDARALDYVHEMDLDISADVLIFPHHGGRPGGGNVVAFAETLVSMVVPDHVIVSNTRSASSAATPGGRGNPVPDIVAGILRAAPTVSLGCTQLSSRCSSTEGWQHNSFADPGVGGRPCAGTQRVDLSDGSIAPAVAAHREFVEMHVERPLCLE